MFLQANLAVQEARYQDATNKLNAAQAEFDEKQTERDEAQALYDNAMKEKKVCTQDTVGDVT